MTLGHTLHEARLNNHYTVEDINQKLSIVPHRLQEFENNNVKPTVTQLSNLCKLYRLDINEIFPLHAPLSYLDLPNSIKLFRQQLNMTQYELSIRLEIAPNMISSWESGHRSPSLRMLKQLSNLYPEHIEIKDNLNISQPDESALSLLNTSTRYSIKLRHLRHQKQLSLAYAAGLSHVSLLYLQYYEHNQRHMTIEHAILLSQFYGVTLNMLLNDDIKLPD